MGITLAGAQRIGAPFYCTISEYVRTIMFQVPRFQIAGYGCVSPIVIKDEPDFRASVMTDPVNYIRNGPILKAHIPDETLEECLGVSGSATEKALYLVLEIKQDLGMFRATDGQCRKMEDAGVEHVFIVDCGAPYVPDPGDRAGAIDVVLTGVQMAFDFAEPFKKMLDTECYFTDEGRRLHIERVELSASVQVVGPITPERTAELAHKSKALIGQLDKAIGDGKPQAGTAATTEYRPRLAELLATLQAEPTNDEAGRRVWFLRLYDRAEKFGATCKWQ